MKQRMRQKRRKRKSRGGARGVPCLRRHRLLPARLFILYYHYTAFCSAEKALLPTTYLRAFWLNPTLLVLHACLVVRLLCNPFSSSHSSPAAAARALPANHYALFFPHLPLTATYIAAYHCMYTVPVLVL